MSEREKFEQWAGRRGCFTKRHDDPTDLGFHGKYMLPVIQRRWEGWKACAAEKDAEIERLRGAAQKMFDALESLPDDALGTAPETHDCPAFSKKDQLLHEVAPVLREAGALAATATDDGWRSMESAPRDGTEVQLIATGGQQYIGRWRLPNRGEPQCESHYKHEWRCSSSGRWATPTHWRPLPAPPTAAEQTGSEEA